MILGPVPCQGCGKSVVWNGKRWKNPGQWAVKHRCPTECGAFMARAGDRCGRRPHGETTPHRSRYAMVNERRAKGAQKLALRGTI